MIPGVKIEPTHSEDEIKGFIDAGERLLREGGYDDGERVQLLPTIISLLSQKTVIQTQMASAPLDLSALHGNVRN